MQKNLCKPKFYCFEKNHPKNCYEYYELMFSTECFLTYGPFCPQEVLRSVLATLGAQAAPEVLRRELLAELRRARVRDTQRDEFLSFFGEAVGVFVM